jgi:hypothetical protein
MMMDPDCRMAVPMMFGIPPVLANANNGFGSPVFRPTTRAVS